MDDLILDEFKIDLYSYPRMSIPLWDSTDTIALG